MEKARHPLGSDFGLRRALEFLNHAAINGANGRSASVYCHQPAVCDVIIGQQRLQVPSPQGKGFAPHASLRFLRLRTEMNWHRLFMEMIGDLTEQGVAERQAAALAEAKVPGPLA